MAVGNATLVGTKLAVLVGMKLVVLIAKRKRKRKRINQKSYRFYFPSKLTI